MYDGVHPSHFLSSIWYCALCHSIVNDLNDKCSDALAMEENEDDIDDSWDFKRRWMFTSKHIWECENC